MPKPMNDEDLDKLLAKRPWDVEVAVNWYINGNYTQSDIAAAINLTREAVRTRMLKYYGQGVMTAAREARAERTRVAKEVRAKERKLHSAHHTQRLSTPAAVVYTYDDMVAAVRVTWEAQGEPASFSHYAYTNARTAGLPSAAVITSRYKWNDVLQDAGITTTRTRKYYSRVSHEEKLVAVMQAVIDIRARKGALYYVAYRDYDEWARGRKNVPCGTLLRRGGDTWPDLRDEATARLYGVEE